MNSICIPFLKMYLIGCTKLFTFATYPLWLASVKYSISISPPELTSCVCTFFFRAEIEEVQNDVSELETRLEKVRDAHPHTLWEVGEWFGFTWHTTGSTRRCYFLIILSTSREKFCLFCFDASAYIPQCSFIFTGFSLRCRNLYDRSNIHHMLF